MLYRQLSTLVRLFMVKANFEYLLAYKITVPIYDYTIDFCRKYIPRTSRTNDQMVQAARSGMQNIAEGAKGQSLKSYIKLAGVARGSLEELLGDYKSYARHNKLEIWNKEKAKSEISEIGAIRKIINEPTLPNQPNFPDLPNNKTKGINLLITLLHQANYLIDKLITSLHMKHQKEGGLTENLYKNRMLYKKNHS